jgi:predicted cobalt transporter CbtA
LKKLAGRDARWSRVRAMFGRLDVEIGKGLITIQNSRWKWTCGLCGTLAGLVADQVSPRLGLVPVLAMNEIPTA